MREYISNSPKETENIAANLSKELKRGDVIAFVGGLGVGKTAFVRGLCEGLHSKGEVSSPTFSLVHEYDGDIPVYHFDMYRINDLDDLYSTGFFDYLDLKGIMAVEWSENIDSVFEDDAIYIEIIRTDENSRLIKISGGNRF